MYNIYNILQIYYISSIYIYICIYVATHSRCMCSLTARTVDACPNMMCELMLFAAAAMRSARRHCRAVAAKDMAVTAVPVVLMDGSPLAAKSASMTCAGACSWVEGMSHRNQNTLTGMCVETYVHTPQRRRRHNPSFSSGR